jgi:asparagine synthase (glutamine-hydrolysing)
MCGIFGFSGSDASADHFFNLMAHRGPDAQICKRFDNWSLGHLRLSIIDVDSAANQPFSAGGAHIVFNGEIYNYVELRDEYLPEIELSTHSDTEILLLLLNEYGTSILNQLNGMFAFAYLDKNGRLLLARDRFGIKPLYYCCVGESIMFSSEIKPLASYIQGLTLDSNVVESFARDTATDYDERSGYNEIYALKKGHYAFLNSGQSIIQAEWYRLPVRTKSVTDINCLTDECEELLLDSIKLRCRADVPLAITLSGGIDSTLIYTLIKEKLGIHVQPFVFKHLSSDIDESSLAVKLANDYGDQPIVVSQNNTSLQDLVKSLWSLELPIWNASSVAYYSMYHAIKSRGFKVVLEGHGSDEQLCGYPHMILLTAIYALSKGNIFNYTKYLRVYKNTCHVGLGQSSTTKTILKLILTNLAHAALKTPQSLNDSLDYAFNYQILPIVLRTFDRLTMANSLESRMPFMDYRFVEFCRKLPDEARISSIGNKSILRRILHKYGKTYIYANKQKIGFSSDIPALLSQPDVRQFLNRAVETFDPHTNDLMELKNRAKCGLELGLGWTNSADYWKAAALGVFSDPCFLMTKP